MFEWLEQSALSMWIKESLSLWPYDILCLSAHAVGMALLVGFSTAIALRVLGYAPLVPLAPMAQFFPVVYLGFWINALSGTGLFISYPGRAGTNPLFWLKLLGVAVAIVCIRRMKRDAFDRPSAASMASARRPAATLPIAWLVAITAGRMLAYKGIPSIETVAMIGTVILAFVAGIIIYTVPGLRPSSKGA
jgi:hypothetical protein